MKTQTAFLICTVALAAHSLAAATITIDAGQPSGKVSPTLYGLMTEEINHSYDGGLYAELIRNRAFMDNAGAPAGWSVVAGEGSAATIALDPSTPLNNQLTNSLRLTVTTVAKDEPVGVANGGYWGIPVQPKTPYRVSLWARADSGFTGTLTASIVGKDGRTVYASGKTAPINGQWNRYNLVIKTGKVAPTADARFQITLDRPGTVWLGFVSLFPPTWNDQPNGFRKDLMQMLVDMHPKFLRFPGGNYVEGDTVETRFNWKKTIGPVEERPGHQCPWGYRSTDGMGLLEFLEWCEDMKAEPVLAVYAGYSLKGAHVNPGPDLEPFVQEAMDEIEYVTGDTTTTWGARRAKDGHPAPFSLHYVEIGNEDWFDKSGSYDARYAQFYDAIKAKYPALKAISTIGNDQPERARVHSRQPDVTDEHYYRAADDFIRTSPNYAKDYDRHGPEIFVGEWAAYDTSFPPWNGRSRNEPPTPPMKSAIADAIFMAAMERNSDLIKMQCYAPLFVNVNPGARQWRPDLIGYDAISSYGSPSYYAIQMFSRNLGDEIVPVAVTDSAVQGCATRDAATGEIFVKLVNPRPIAESVNFDFKGVPSLASNAEMITLAANPEDSNSIKDPAHVLPVTTTLHEAKPQFTETLPPNSIVVLKLRALSNP